MRADAPAASAAGSPGVPHDPALPFLSDALDLKRAARALSDGLAEWLGPGGRIELHAATAVRHKPGRRCLIEYLAVVARDGLPTENVALLGKVRAKGADRASYRVQTRLFHGGFGPAAADGIAVPEPLGVVPAFHMWVQRKVEGQPATGLLLGHDGVEVARRMAEAAHKLHQTHVPTSRRHTIHDELAILHDRLRQVANARPGWRRRIERLLTGCERLAAATPLPAACGIHRDYYADQLLVDGARLALVDLDLYCHGDPALDAGNAIAHVTELALRTTGDPTALAVQERALEERFVQLAGDEALRPALRLYTTLTLARHVSLSTQLPGRRHTTAPLLDLCDERLCLTP